MMHGREKSDSAIVAAKLVNKAGRLARSRWSEGQGPRGRRHGEARAGHRTGRACPRRWTAFESRKGKEEGEVYCALPPSQCRSARAGAFRTQGQRRARCGWADMDGLRGKS
jgi:hypothetical protein